MRSRSGLIPRSASLICLGALTVHQLRYSIACGPNAHQALVAQGHGYWRHASVLCARCSITGSFGSRP